MSGFVVRQAWLIPSLPLLGAGLAILGKKRRMITEAHVPVVAGIAAAFLASLFLLFSAGPDETATVMRWLTISDLEIPIEFRVDGLTTMMLSMVTFVSTLVAIFAAGYMAGDPAYPRFFALIGLFVASMTGLVLSNNYVLTYVFWEGVGVCSYLLIGFWHSKPSASAAAMKAFLFNRVGDFGFAIAIFWLWSIVPQHDLSYGNILNKTTLGALPHDAIVGISLLLFWAATAKSAQIPLYVWLPDAMEGPTPVSGLDSCRDNGDGRRLFDRAFDAPDRRSAGRATADRHHWLRDRVALGVDRGHSDRPEARAGLLDGQSVGLHVHGAVPGLAAWLSSLW